MCPVIRPLVSLALLALLFPACDPKERPYRPGAVAQISLSSAGQALHAGDTLLLYPRAQPDEVMGRVALTNPGSAPLEIQGVTLVTDPPGVAQVVLAGGDANPTLAPRGEETLEIVILGADASQGPLVGGRLEIRHSETLANGELTALDVGPRLSGMRLDWSPSVLAFGLVQAEGVGTRTLTLMNTGDVDVEVSRFAVEGDVGFTLDGGVRAQIFDAALVIPAGTTRPVDVHFAPESPSPSQATLLLYGTSPAADPVAAVPLQGNASGPCVSVTPHTVDFGSKLVGSLATMEVTVRSCGTEALVLSAVSLDDPTGRFALELPSDFAGAMLAPNESLVFPVTYLSAEESPLDPATGERVWDTATLVMETNTFTPAVEVPVRGLAVTWACATPVLMVSEGEEVVPQTALHLVGSQSQGFLPITQYGWEVSQPQGSTGVFLPSPHVADPTFVANVAGAYTFRLHVVDSSGAPGCFVAERQVLVIPDEAIHVELLWETSGDVNGYDAGPEAGTDVDLHFLHPFAQGEDFDGDGVVDGWFDKPFDTAWDNMHPNWGSQDPAIDDNPGLDLDDTDGSGPENLNLNIPEDGLTYTVGVHYWEDYGYGPSRVTVRVYIHRELMWEKTGVELVHGDMWCAAYIDWPSGQVRDCEGEGEGLDIMPNVFPSDYFGYDF